MRMAGIEYEARPAVLSRIARDKIRTSNKGGHLGFPGNANIDKRDTDSRQMNNTLGLT